MGIVWCHYYPRIKLEFIYICIETKITLFFLRIHYQDNPVQGKYPNAISGLGLNLISLEINF
jgi:hypothetical protein